MKFKKLVSLGLALSVLTLSTFTIASASAGKVTVKLGIWPEATLKDDIKMHEGFVKKYNAKYPNVNIVPAYYKYGTDTFVPLAQSGNLPTVFETWYTEPQKLIEGQFVKDITPELKQLGWDKAMNPTIKELLSKNGKIYGIPRDGYALGLMINVQLFKKAGLVDSKGLPNYPKTWTELAKDAKIIKDKTGAAGLCLLAKDNAGGWHFSNIAWDFGAKLEAQKNGKWVAQLNSAQAIAAMNYVKDLKWKYNVLTADPTNEDWGSGFKQLGTGAAAMYIGANDAVNQVTQVNKLPVKDLSIAPLPKGPAAQYSLMGGTPYMFSAKATNAEVMAALRYIEIMGRAPVVNPDTIAGLQADAKNRVDAKIPVIPSFPAWIAKDYVTAQNAAVTKYRNVNMDLYNDYYGIIKKKGNLHLEEPKCTQDMYGELTKVMQAVITDKNANVKSLMDKANKNLQSILDDQVNN